MREAAQASCTGANRTSVWVDSFGFVTESNVFKAIGDEGIALKLVRSKDGRELLAGARNYSGWTALHQAVALYESVAQEMIINSDTGLIDYDGLRLLAATKNELGNSALHTVIVFHKQIASKLTEVEKTERLQVVSFDNNWISAHLCAKFQSGACQSERLLLDTTNAITAELRSRLNKMARTLAVHSPFY